MPCYRLLVAEEILSCGTDPVSDPVSALPRFACSFVRSCAVRLNTLIRQISLVCINGIAGVVAYFGTMVAYGHVERHEGDFLGEMGDTFVSEGL